MPYITPHRRERIDTLYEAPANAGELNYVITREITRYLAMHGASYTIFNEVMGAIEGARAEFYRRVVAPYEDEKRLANGDVYGTIVSEEEKV